MKNGLYIGTGDSYIEKYSQNSADLSLIGKGGNCEIMIQKIAKGSNAFIEPTDLPESMEFFYVLEGKLVLKYDDENQIIQQGDYFYTHHLVNSIHFETLEDVKLLYLSNEPVFKYLSETIQELSELAKHVETKDPYTHGHSDRVQKYSIQIANELKLSKSKIEDLTYASLFHDIGKTRIPDEILLKPGPLTKAEYDVMKEHPLHGVDLVQKTYYRNLSGIIGQHHERIDGSGYPFGLKGDAIVIEAKIIAVADTFDSMTTDRPYRKGLPRDIAISEIKKYSGVHYDPSVVEAFLNVVTK